MKKEIQNLTFTGPIKVPKKMPLYTYNTKLIHQMRAGESSYKQMTWRRLESKPVSIQGMREWNV